MIKDFSYWILDLIKKIGLNPLYTITILLSIIFINDYFKYYRKWNTLSKLKKHSLISLLLCTILGVLLSILRLLGVIKINNYNF